MSKTLYRLAACVLILGAVSLGGCDKEKAGGGQPQASVDDGTVPEVGDANPSPSDEGKLAYTIDRSRAGKPVPDLRFTGDDDASIALADYRGKPLLLNLWATWCAPCIAEMPALDSLAAKMQGKMAVVAVSQDLKGAVVVDPFFAKRGLKQLKPYLDPDNKLGLGLEASSLPTTLIIDAQGKEVARVTGGMDWAGGEASALIAEAMR